MHEPSPHGLPDSQRPPITASAPTASKDSLDVTFKHEFAEADIPTFAHINDAALEGDPFKQWRLLFTEGNEYDSTIKALTEALTDPDYRVIKAVISDPNDPSADKIIGFIHYLHAGYIQLKKTDPFAATPPPSSASTTTTTTTQEIADERDPTSKLPELLAEKADQVSDVDPDRADRLRRGQMKYVQSRSVYIAAIRGKRHMYIRRLMVLPEYQRKGIAGRLLKTVTDEADKLKIWCWLHSRPAGEPLYKKMGFEELASWDMNEPELECPVFKSMRRLPRPVPQGS